MSVECTSGNITMQFTVPVPVAKRWACRSAESDRAWAANVANVAKFFTAQADTKRLLLAAMIR